jgi:hypothetical protein
MWANDRNEWLACRDLVVVCPSSVPLFVRTAMSCRDDNSVPVPNIGTEC